MPTTEAVWLLRASSNGAVSDRLRWLVVDAVSAVLNSRCIYNEYFLTRRWVFVRVGATFPTKRQHVFTLLRAVLLPACSGRGFLPRL